jgi:hypothetical protein
MNWLNTYTSPTDKYRAKDVYDAVEVIKFNKYVDLVIAKIVDSDFTYANAYNESRRYKTSGLKLLSPNVWSPWWRWSSTPSTSGSLLKKSGIVGVKSLRTYMYYNGILNRDIKPVLA